MRSEDDVAYATSHIPIFRQHVKETLRLIKGGMKAAELDYNDDVVAISIFQRALDLILDDDSFWDNL